MTILVTKSPVEATLTFPHPIISVNSVPGLNEFPIGIVIEYVFPFDPPLLRTVITSFFKNTIVSKSEKRIVDREVT